MLYPSWYFLLITCHSGSLYMDSLCLALINTPPGKAPKHICHIQYHHHTSQHLQSKLLSVTIDCVRFTSNVPHLEYDFQNSLCIARSSSHFSIERNLNCVRNVHDVWGWKVGNRPKSEKFPVERFLERGSETERGTDPRIVMYRLLMQSNLALKMSITEFFQLLSKWGIFTGLRI